MLEAMGDLVMIQCVATAKHKQKRASVQKENRIPSTKPSSRVSSPGSLKELFAQRDAAKPVLKKKVGLLIGSVPEQPCHPLGCKPILANGFQADGNTSGRRMFDRKVNARHAELIKAFCDSAPWIPALNEAPDGWHKYLEDDLLICSEGEFWNTLYSFDARKASTEERQR
jgi:hypothetical protein